MTRAVTPPPDWDDGTEAGAALRRFLATGYVPNDRAVSYYADVAPVGFGWREPTDARLASLLQVWGAAPYVGDPFIYRWRVAVDAGRPIASSPAEIVPLPAAGRQP